MRLETDYFSYYFILKIAISIMLAIVLIQQYKALLSTVSRKSIAKWSLLFLVGICGIGLYRVIFDLTSQCSLQYGISGAGIFNALDASCNIIFFISLISFIQDFKDFELIMYFFVVAGIFTILDFIFLYKMELITSVVHIVKPEAAAQRYNGIIQNDYVSMGKFLAFAIGGCMYFWITEKRIKWFFMALILFHIITYTAQRTNILMALIVISTGCITWASLRISKYQFVPLVSLSIGLLIVILYLFPLSAIYLEMRGGMLTDPQELYSRLFLWAHAINFPIPDLIVGVGPGESEYCLAKVLKASTMEFVFDYNLSLRGSDAPRGFHNAYLTFAIEYGLLGLLMILWLSWILFKLNGNVRKHLHRLSCFHTKLHVAYNISFSVMIALLFGYWFDHHYEWIIIFLSIFLTFLISELIMASDVLSHQEANFKSAL